MVRRYIERLPKSIEEAAEWYMRYISPLTLIAALIIDTFFLLRRVDTLLTSLVLFFYLALAALISIVISLIQTGRLRHEWILKITPILPVISQYAYGGLFIAFLSLYSRSASAAVAWIFVGVLAVLLVVNERFVRLYMRFPFQMGILFTVLFSFLIFYMPLLFGFIGPWMFVASGVTSLLLIAAFLYFHSYLTPELLKSELTATARAIATIFVIFNVLYFTNAIPPLPLALKESGVYHDITRSGGEYRLSAEESHWYEAYLPINDVFHREQGESAYAYSAIFAPSGLSATIFHEWQFYDEERGWVTEETVSFPIRGGREGGYRGYSIKNGIKSGYWRINVVTGFGQVIGRISFTVEDVEGLVPLHEVIR